MYKIFVLIVAVWSFWSPWWVMEQEMYEQIDITLDKGWNLVSIPLNEIVNKSDLYVVVGDDVYNWSEAVNSSLINDSIFSWSSQFQNYEPVDKFESCNGYWVYSFNESILKYIII